jgi:2-dehydropantoate 2-reductase
VDSVGPRRLVVLGAGAIGASVGALLFEAGAPCVLVARGDHGAALARDGVDLRFPDAARRIRVPVVATLAEAAPTPDDLVMLSVMAHHTEQAIATLDAAVPIASFQNGLAPLEIIARRGHPTLAAMVYVPAERRAPGVIALAGVPVVGSIMLGAWSGSVPATWLATKLGEAGFRASIEDPIAPWIRAKLLTNLAGIVVALCDDPPKDVIEAAQAEARSVWQSAGEPFEDIDALMGRVGSIETAVVDGAPRIGGSTRHALARGEPLETAALHGSIIDAARARGIATPVNDGLVRIAAQATRERWKPGSIAPATLRTWL